MEKKIKYLIFFSVIFLIGIAGAGLEVGYDEDLPKVEIKTRPPSLNNTIENINSSTFAEIWITNEGDQDNVADLLFSELTWSFADDWNYIEGGDFTFNETKLASIIYNATNINTIEGTLLSGDIDSIHIPEDENVYNVSEDAGGNPLLININFTGISDFDSLIGRIFYDGGQGHEIQVEIQRSDTGVWENYIEITDTTDFVNFYVPVFDPEQHIYPNGVVAVRFDHFQNGISAHNFYIDYLNMVDGFTALTVADHDGLSGRDDRTNHPWAMPQNSSEDLYLKDVFASEVVGLFDVTDEHYLKLIADSGKLGASDRSILINVEDDDRRITLTGDPELGNCVCDQDVSIDGNVTHNNMTLIEDLVVLGNITTNETVTTNSLILPDENWDNILTIKKASQQFDSNNTLSLRCIGDDFFLWVQGDTKLNQDLLTSASPTFVTVNLDYLNIGDNTPTAGSWVLDVNAKTLPPVIGQDGKDGEGINLLASDGQSSRFEGTSGNGSDVNIRIGAKGIGLDGADDGARDGILNISGALHYESTTATSQYLCWDTDGHVFLNETGC